jgi:hypothetical protein
MIKDGQVRKLCRLLDAGACLAVAAGRTGMDEKTARKYRDLDRLPSEVVRPRTWRTRKDPFEAVWPEVLAQLEAEPKLRPFALFEWLQDKYPQRFSDGQRRTFERRVRAWRAGRGPNQEVMFPQVHVPGDLGASDFTCMNTLGITIGRQSFDHMLYHFTLTYSNWEAVSVCFSESFEALSRGLQESLWKLGGVPRKHRSDSLSAAVNNLSEDRDFRARYRDLLEYYRMEPHRINARKAHENGDIESSHGHLKRTIEQALLLRGSRDFATREDYEAFLEEVIAKRNTSRSVRLEQEEAFLGELPPGRLDYRTQVRDIKVRSSSTIQVKRNTYSVPSRLIGHKVDVLIDADCIEVRHGEVIVQRMPRMTGTGKHAVNYRHVIDSLVRKPGAFENYRYREDMFPTSHFRMAYDALCRGRSAKAAAREYLKILQLAARDSQDAVQDALRLAIVNNAPISAEEIRRAVEQHQEVPATTDVVVGAPDLDAFDVLLQHPDMEVNAHDYGDKRKEDVIVNSETFRDRTEERRCEGDQHRVDGAVSRSSHANVPRAFREPCGQSRPGIEQSYRVPGRVDRSGMPGTSGKPNCTIDARLETSDDEDLEQLRLDSSSADGLAADGKLAGWCLSGSSGEPVAVWETRFREEPLSDRTRGATGSSRTFSTVHHMQPVGPAVVDCETRFAVG